MRAHTAHDRRTPWQPYEQPYQWEQTHPVHGDMIGVLRGLLRHARLPWLLRHHERTPVLAAFAFLSGCICFGAVSLLAAVTGRPLVFPSLGPTAFLFFYRPTAPSAAPRNAVVGHAIGIAAGYFCLVITGLTHAGPALSQGVTLPRVIAATLSLSLTNGLMVLLHSPHPPAGATTLIVSLGLLTTLPDLGLLMGSVILLTALASLINRLAGVPYPLWTARQDLAARGKRLW